MSLRYRKIGERFKEVEGKSFEKISEEIIKRQEIIAELKQSIVEVRNEKGDNRLQVQKLERELIAQIRSFNQLKKKLLKQPEEV